MPFKFKFDLKMNKTDQAKEKIAVKLRQEINIASPKALAVQLLEKRTELESEGYVFDITSGFVSVYKDNILLFKKDRFIYFGTAYSYASS